MVASMVDLLVLKKVALLVVQRVDRMDHLWVAKLVGQSDLMKAVL
jgi:hypothetical protein